MKNQGFLCKEAAEIVGVTYRQIDYWARTNLVKPSLATARGSGTRRMYSYRDLLELRIIKKLLDAGIRLEKVRIVHRPEASSGLDLGKLLGGPDDEIDIHATSDATPSLSSNPLSATGILESKILGWLQAQGFRTEATRVLLRSADPNQSQTPKVWALLGEQMRIVN